MRTYLLQPFQSQTINRTRDALTCLGIGNRKIAVKLPAVKSLKARQSGQLSNCSQLICRLQALSKPMDCSRQTTIVSPNISLKSCSIQQVDTNVTASSITSDCSRSLTGNHQFSNLVCNRIVILISRVIIIIIAYSRSTSNPSGRTQQYSNTQFCLDQSYLMLCKICPCNR